ncbi:MAG: bifunctional riboflavin kinase/FAD synthetase [Cellulosilyticaceae bacterium]
MRYIYGTTEITQMQKSIVVLGNFDGVHLGHQKLFEVAKQKAKQTEFQIVALSFYPHPTWVVGNNPKPLLMSRRDRKNKINSVGVDVFIEYPFDEVFAAISADDFFKNILIDALKAEVVIVGSNYYFGKNKQGDIHYMTRLGEQYGVEVCIVNTVKCNGQDISSTHIRQLVVDGQIEEVNNLLGHPYTIIGNVIHGKKLGRTIGFPTINVIADPQRAYPPNGVYATIVKVYNKHYMGITNIGVNPTVNGKHKIIETYIMDFDKSIYGEEVEICFYTFIRHEQKFPSIEALALELEKNKIVARRYLKNQFDSLQSH